MHVKNAQKKIQFFKIGKQQALGINYFLPDLKNIFGLMNKLDLFIYQNLSIYEIEKCWYQNKSRTNKMKQDNNESINILDNVNLERIYVAGLGVRHH